MSRHLHLFATGGTIASHFNGATWQSLPGHELVLELGLRADQVKVSDLASGDSASITPAQMAGFARAINEAIDDGAAGIVLTHGTDTMEQSAYVLDLLLGPTLRVPVVVTGSMRPHSHDAPDGPTNLADALALAAHSDLAAHGVVVALNGKIHRAAEVTKINATSTDAFVSVPGPPLGTFAHGVATLGPVRDRNWVTPKNLDREVAFLSVYPGMDKELLTTVGSGCDGLVLEVFGALNLPLPLWQATYDLAHGGVAVVFAGRPYATGWTDGGLDFLGVVGSCGRSALKARLALMAALATGTTKAETRTLLGTYLNGTQP